jgi:putative endopeptidase
MTNNYAKILMSIAILLLIFMGCSQMGSDNEKVVGFDLSNIDSTVSPKDNFYQYAVGNWIKNNPVPDDQTRWGAFNVLIEETNDQIKTIIDEAVSKMEEGNSSLAGKVGVFYSSGMDTAKIEKLGFSPIKEEIEKISSIDSKENLVKHVAYMHKYIGSPLFTFYSTVDAKNSDSVITGIWQSGLGLPDRDYYVKEDSRSQEIRAKYVEHVKNMFDLINDKNSENSAKSIMAFETRLAKASNTNLENRNPEATYNKFTLKQLAEQADGFDWTLYFNEVDLGDPGVADVGQPKFIAEIGEMMKSISLEDWKIYLTWNLLRTMSPYLSSQFVNERFNFTGKFLSGQKVDKPRWKRVQATTSAALGEAIGQLYAEKYFPPEAKEKAVKIVEALKVSLKERIENLDWMTDDTKKQAIIKLNAFGLKIGYPDKWTDYTDFKVTNDSYIENVFASNYFDHKETLAKINQPVRDWEWPLTPQTVNAGYSPTKNEIIFPAAILQSPFFNVNVDDAINYGGMGYVIGHEMTHGFDDQGRQFDEKGNIRDWWLKEDSDNFKERAQKIIDQFSAFEPLDSLFINGELTQGENIADLGGLIVSFNAFKKTEQYKKGELIDGFTPAQRFYLNSAQVWKTNITDEALEVQIKTDPHSPARYRVLGPLRNIPEFYEAFNVKEGDGMYRSPSERVKIW